MSSMTPAYWVAASWFFVIGLILCALLGLAEGEAYFVKGKKKYRKNGKIIYFVIYLIMILFVMLMEPGYGMEPYLDIFNEVGRYESGSSLFSLEGLYDASKMEPFFMLWVSTIRSITNNQSIFIFVTFSYIWLCVLHFSSTFYKKKYFTITFMAIWPALIDFIFGMRYALAVATCLLAMSLFKKHRYVLGALFTFVASFTHFLAFTFVLLLGFYFVASLLFKDKINSLKVLLFMVAGGAVFTTIGYSIFSTFRFAYRMTDTVESNSILSYAPMVMFAFVILYYNRNKNMDFGDNLCSMAAYFNMIMLPVTAMWGVYRIPYLFLLPIAAELNNSMSMNKRNKLLNLAVVVIILVFSFVKIITMGVQNDSLEYTFNF